ncbi:Protein MNN4 [Pleurostoma richardsiae]|uniref:Protein MNN4 n=1 Tax=Pleurostoma richardsiae TaxID=41990 RepID=A0AA38RNC7_9PEZI|nr:Protein MNN4 [Pleurostoma richardsiae]
MRLDTLLCLSTLVLASTSAPLQGRDADFLSVRRKLRKDMSGKRGDPPDKYFHESVFHPHYDGRFADHVLDYAEQKKALKNLVQTYLATFSDLGIETWLMHGSLLGWWWNKQIMPWDSDVDVQVSETSMYYLAAYYNMSVFHYKTPRIPDGRDYMIEVNPHYKNREQTDKLNVIDARWIDTESGLFIDITTVRYNTTHPDGEGMLSCKDGHEYRDTYIFPLRDTVFEGIPAKIPYKFKDLLENEYGKKSLTNTDFNHHIFDDDKMQWIPKVRDIDPEK